MAGRDGGVHHQVESEARAHFGECAQIDAMTLRIADGEERKAKAHRAAHQRDHQRFQQDHDEEARAAHTDGDEHADLARTLQHGHQHGVQQPEGKADAPIARRVNADEKRIINGQTDVNQLVPFKYKWAWRTLWPFIFRLDASTGQWVPNLLVEGFLTTIRLAVWGILFAGILGTLMGLARHSKRLFFRLLGGSYVMLIRNIPPVVFVFVFVFFIASQIMPKLALGDSVGRMSETAQWWISIFFGSPKLIDHFLQFTGLLASRIPQAELSYRSADSADADSDQPHGLILFADGFHQLYVCPENLVIVVCGCG